MARDIFINGETLVSVKGNVNTTISALTQLGLTDPSGVVTITFNNYHDDILVDTFGPNTPMDEQIFLTDANITMTLVQFDEAVLEVCQTEAMGGVGFGTLGHAGTRLGGGNVRFAANNHYIGLNLSSPIAGKPYRFYFAYLAGTPIRWPLGTKRSLVELNWRAIAYTTDPWNAGLGAFGQVLFDRTLDT